MAKILMQRVTWRSVTPIIFETALVVAAVAASAYVQLGADAASMVGVASFLPKAVLIALVCQLCLYFADLYDYDARVLTDPPELVIRLLKSLGASSLILAGLYLLFPDLILGRGVFVLAVVFLIGTLVGWRTGFEWIADRVGPRERLLLVGTRPATLNLARELLGRRELGVEIVGFIEPEMERAPAWVPGPGVIGTIADIPRIVREHGVDRVVVSLRDARGKLPMDELLEMKLSGVAFDHLASVYEEYTGKIAIENLRPSWLVFSSGFRKPGALRATKRAIDMAAASIGLPLAAPLMLLVAIATWLSSRGPVFYHQERTGQHGRPFTVHKFRTMRENAETGTGPVWARAGDPRVTRVGGFLRRTRLDELPQLWNVLRGDMSLVGPRPERPEFVSQLTQEIPFYGQRHAVKPGLTGWAQVRYTYGASVEDAMEKLQYDLFYIKNLSIALDLVIMFATAKTVLLRRGAR